MRPMDANGAVLVVGAGIMGLSIAWALRRAGRAVTVMDQGPIPNPLGASWAEQRTLRLPYGDHTGYTEMALESFGAWGALWQDLGRSFYRATGALVLGGPLRAFSRASAQTLARLGLPVEWLTAAEAADAYPLLDFSGLDGALRVAHSGTLRADLIAPALIDWLTAAGTVWKPRCRVTAVDPVGRVRLADGSVLTGSAVIIAPGADLTGPAERLAERVRPTRRLTATLAPPPDVAAAWAGYPQVLDLGPDGDGFYLCPPDGDAGLKIGDHRAGPTDEPPTTSTDRRPTLGALGRLWGLGRARIRGFDDFRLRTARSCWYASTADERFVVEREGVAVWLSACSGHGYKFAPLLALELADVLADGQPFDRFAEWARGLMPADDPRRRAL